MNTIIPIMRVETIPIRTPITVPAMTPELSLLAVNNKINGVS